MVNHPISLPVLWCLTVEDRTRYRRPFAAEQGSGSVTLWTLSVHPGWAVGLLGWGNNHPKREVQPLLDWLCCLRDLMQPIRLRATAHDE